MLANHFKKDPAKSAGFRRACGRQTSPNSGEQAGKQCSTPPKSGGVSSRCAALRFRF